MDTELDQYTHNKVEAGIIKDELFGPFLVKDGLKINSQTYYHSLEDTFFKQLHKKKVSIFQEVRDFYASHALEYSTMRLVGKVLKMKE